MLKSRRVTLRALAREDLPRLHEFNNDLEVELLGGGDPPIPQPLARLQAQFDQDAARAGRDDTNFVIEADGTVIGQCGLYHFDWTAHSCGLGIAIGDRAYWGQGYGRESVTVLLEYAFRYRNFQKVWLTVNSTNERAIRSYNSCGFVQEGRLRRHTWNDGKYVDLIYMGVLKEEWEAKNASLGQE